MASKKTTSSAVSRAATRPRTGAAASRTGAGAYNTGRSLPFILRLRPDQYRLLGAVLMLFFGFVGIVSWFDRDGTLMKAYFGFISAQVGWGYYPMPLCMLLSAWLMFTNKNRPCAGRVVCAMIADLLFGSFVQLAGCRLETLYSFPRLMDSGLGYALSQLIVYGQDPVYCCGGMFSGLLGALLYTCLRRVFGCMLLVVIIIPLCVHALGGDVRALARFILGLPFKVKPAVLSMVERWRDYIRSYTLDDDDLYDTDDDFGLPKSEYEEFEQHEENTGSKSELFDFDQEAADTEEKKAYELPSYDELLQVLQHRTYRRPSEEELFQAILGSQRNSAADSVKFGVRNQSAADRAGCPSIDMKLDDVEIVPRTQSEEIPDAQDKEEPLKSAATIETSAPAYAAEQKQKKTEKLSGPKTEHKIKAEPEPEPEPKQEPGPEQKPIPAPEEPTDQYIFPPLELLKRGSGDAGIGEESDENRDMLEAAIRSFGVSAQVVGVVRGPSVTRYEMKLAQGVKLSRITNLSGDIALSLGVSGVRIAPIADKISTVGVEVPNRKTTTVWLGDTIDTDTFRKSKSKLSIALGKDISGSVIVGNIAKMPHVLIAGTTGSGKSVCINSLILSLLYKSTPDEVKLIMVDPKMVELGIYNGLPHMLTPVVTDPKKAAGSLQWAVVEMLKRYRLFSEVGVRDLAGYNAVLQANDQKIFPQVVIIIDELADLMMTAKKEVEESICRIAQMGRAAGMHLVVATQRPSSDVITGLMKANIPSRIAFAVSSGIESRIILDQQGAEKLIGMGDMLYAPIGVGKPVRIQGAFVTDEEREEVINFIKSHCEAEYDDEATRAIEKNAAALENDSKKKGTDDFESGTDSAGEEYDELLPQAVDVIFEVKQASTSMLQRRLKLGYSRAGRLIDQLEQLGVVGPYQGSKPREILMTKQQWQERQYIHGTAPTDSIAAELTDIADSRGEEDEAEFLEDED